MAISIDQAKRIIEAALLYNSEPISIKDIAQIFHEEDEVNEKAAEDLLKTLVEDYRGRGIELVKVASGYRFQICEDLSPWITRLMSEKPARYSRALLETLALIAYKQPITRAEIEQVRGVVVSTNIVRTLQEREWIKVIGHRDVPGKPALYATTKRFLDDLNLTSLSDLPTLAEIQDLDDGQLTEQLKLELGAGETESEAESVAESESESEGENSEETEGEYEIEFEVEIEDEVEVDAEVEDEVDDDEQSEQEDDSEERIEEHENEEHELEHEERFSEQQEQEQDSEATEADR